MWALWRVAVRPDANPRRVGHHRPGLFLMSASLCTRTRATDRMMIEAFSGSTITDPTAYSRCRSGSSTCCPQPAKGAPQQARRRIRCPPFVRRCVPKQPTSTLPRFPWPAALRVANLQSDMEDCSLGVIVSMAVASRRHKCSGGAMTLATAHTLHQPRSARGPARVSAGCGLG